MAYDTFDTIAAVATPPGAGLRGIVRISGDAAVACAAGCFEADDRRHLAEVTVPEVIAGRVSLEGDLRRLPGHVYLWPTGRSYTRQPTAEIHTLASPPLVEQVLRAVCAAGARVAEPGEFTLRAFLAGRLDLTQAEAVLGVIDARDRGQLDAALAQLAGGLSTPLARLRDDLLDLLAQIEAGLDFVEDDIEFVSPAEVERQLHAAARAVDGMLATMESRETTDEVLRAVLIGWPNTGKSSLFNALAGRRAALVSDQSGTTRDYLSCRLATRHAVWELIDTAGIDPRGDLDAVESLAQQHGAGQHREADVKLLCLDATRPLNDWEASRLAELDRSHTVVVLTKTDAPRILEPIDAAVETSSVTGRGLDVLSARLDDWADAASRQELRIVASTAARCRQCLAESATALERAAALVGSGGEELIAAEIRLTLDALGQVVGAVYTDDVLDRIFSRFCIGK